MTHTTIISAAALATHIAAANWRVIDCRHDIAKPDAGEQRYRQGHLPGALFAHLDRDLSGPRVAGSGRHPLPSAAAFAQTCSDWGIDAQVQVVAYDDAGGAYAARLWWLLRAAGHASVAVLDGGIQAWQAAGQPLEQKVVLPLPRQFIPQPVPGLTLGAAEVAVAAASPQALLLDARATERFAGRVEPVDPVAGHVPGAINRPFQNNLGADGRFLPANELRQQLTALLGARSPANFVSMCGSGVTACHTLLAFEIAGLAGGRLYPGSWSEWCSLSSRPVATGNES